MTVVVRVETLAGAYAFRVEDTRGVVAAEALTPLPSAAEHVLGLLDHGGMRVPVLAVFGIDGEQVLVLQDGADGVRFGLLVHRVTGLLRLSGPELEPAPAGQDEPLVAGVVRRPGAEALLVDIGVLGRRLGPDPLPDRALESRP